MIGIATSKLLQRGSLLLRGPSVSKLCALGSVPAGWLLNQPLICVHPVSYNQHLHWSLSLTATGLLKGLMFDGKRHHVLAKIVTQRLNAEYLASFLNSEIGLSSIAGCELSSCSLSLQIDDCSSRVEDIA
jgi:hypothetical protein